MSGPGNVLAFPGPDDEPAGREPVLGALAPAQAEIWTAWLSANTPSPWRVGEWDAATWLFTGDVDNRSTVAYRCTVAACDRISRTQALCDLCEKAFRKSELALEEFRDSFVPDRNRVIDGGARPCIVAGCARDGAVWGLCAAHGSLRHKDMMRKRPGAEELEAWVAAAAPYDPLPACLVGGCVRDWRPGSGICDLHTRRLKADGLEVADAAWLDRQAPFLIVNQFSLAPLEPVARAELLFALAARDSRGQRLDPTAVRQSVAVLAGHRIAAIAAVALGALPSRATANVDALLRETFRVVAAAFDRFRGVDPATRPTLDLVDLGARSRHGRPTARPGDLDISMIRQVWLREILVAWISEAKPTTSEVRRAHRAVQTAARALDARTGGGLDPARLGFADMTAVVAGFENLLRADGQEMSQKNKGSLLSMWFKVLDWGRLTERLDGMAASFARHSSHVIKQVQVNEDEIGRAIPESVINQLDAHTELLGAGIAHGRLSPEQVHAMAVAVYELLRDTGRRPAEIGQLEVDCLERDGEDWQLRWDNSKGLRKGRRLPIPSETVSTIHTWQAVRQAIALPSGSEGFLFPPAGEFGEVRHLISEQISPIIRAFADAVPQLLAEEFGPDGRPLPFDRSLIFPYAFRHAYCQRHADAGVPIDVLRDLMDHRSTQTTSGYYTVSLKRKREAVAIAGRHGFDRAGRARPTRSGTAYEAQSVAVPYGRCTEPANVRAGGSACAIRFQCAACQFFRADPSYLPEMEQHVMQLRADRERALAMDVDEYVIKNFDANIEAMGRIVGIARDKLEALPEEERAELLAATEALRIVRAQQADGITDLGMPGFPRRRGRESA
ncbi:tyrosine-type recombinase/integrase [Nonomuraea guangzhouensis]|uniref:Tyrosine-type recombinase/integrase n=1 Tax=Nonomuraea guangzhouensis TaxID=1291555 RepID=A0ABW4GG74_9ACTN|nr:tyrosine-type recombinase/integrase [Nonomuraea guangzhouensis]